MFGKHLFHPRNQPRDRSSTRAVLAWMDVVPVVAAKEAKHGQAGMQPEKRITLIQAPSQPSRNT